MTDLKPFGDIDKDGKSNMMDCYPYDPNRQGITELVKSAKGKIKGFKEERDQAFLEQSAKRETYTYIIIKYINDGWQNVGAFTLDNIDAEVNKYRNATNVEQVVTSKDPNAADKLNRELILQQLKEGAQNVGRAAKNVGKGVAVATEGAGIRQVRENVGKAFETTDRSKEDMKRFAAGPTGRPPASKGWWGSIQERVVDRSDYKGGHPFKSDKEHLKIPKEDTFEFEPEPEPEQQRMLPRRSRNYQEQSRFGRGVVPYRPVSYEEATLRNPIKKYHYPPAPIYRPQGQMSFGNARPKGMTLGIKPIKAKFKFVKRL